LPFPSLLPSVDHQTVPVREVSILIGAAVGGPFTVRRSPFTVRRSAFGVRRLLKKCVFWREILVYWHNNGLHFGFVSNEDKS
jgi:hypothetical protein